MPLYSTVFSAREGKSFLLQVKKKKGNSHPLSFQFVTTVSYEGRTEQVVVFNKGFFPNPTPQVFTKITNILMAVLPSRNVALLS